MPHAAALALVACLACEALHDPAHSLLLAGGSLCPCCAHDVAEHAHLRDPGQPVPADFGLDDDGADECPDPDCDNGVVERFEDRFNPVEGHYQRTWREACPHCNPLGLRGGR